MRINQLVTDEPPTTSIDWPAELIHHNRWLRTVVAARVREREGVDEVMQEVALAAMRQAAPIHDPSKTAPWLYRVAVFQSLLYRRKMGRLRKLTCRVVVRYQEPDTDLGVSDPLGWLLADERKRIVREALTRLSRKDAEILLLKYTESWSYQQIGQHLGLSSSAVEARLHRARKRMRFELAELSLVETGS